MVGGWRLPDGMSKSDEERAGRLAEALRENLKRRKAQSRDRGAITPSEERSDERSEERSEELSAPPRSPR